MEYYAHSLEINATGNWQPLQAHLLAVANLAAARGKKFYAADIARQTGLLHDLGKYTVSFQKRLRGGERVDHATAGAVEIKKLSRLNSGSGIAAALAAHCIAGHHGGLPNSIGDLDERLKKELEPLDSVWRAELSLDDALLKLPEFAWAPRKLERLFQVGFLGRMIFSCLVDADFRDTEDFYAKAKNTTKDRDWPQFPDIVDKLITRLDHHFEQLTEAAKDTPLNRLRAEILAHVRAGSAKDPGAFSLNVPTGGGKTLASLAFALDHARRYQRDRIIYAIPFTSVIDQTASIFKNILGEDVILEHHSSIDEEKSVGREARDKLRLAMEDWAAPIVVTTNVQLFESLHSHRPSRCRRLHNLANSVIVLDEAQTIPLSVLRPCVAALDELTRNYGVSVVVCTATQPAIAAPDFAGGLALGPERELAPDPRRLHQQLRRVTISEGGARDDDALLEELAASEQGLVIVNSRAHALDLYRAARECGLDGATHLTTRQCAAHRRIILGEVRQALKEDRPCRLIATSLVEAGVDIDFPRVWRARAGLDQIAQAAGRCNREGLRPVEDSIVMIFDAPERKPPHELRAVAEDMVRVAAKHDDMLSPDAMQDYFGEVYWRKGDERLDKFNVLQGFKASADELDFSYRTIGETFRLIESGMAPVIVLFDDTAKDVINRLRSGHLSPGAAARALQSYIVQIPPRARALMLANGHVEFVGPPGQQGPDLNEFAVLKTDSLYDAGFGLFWEHADYLGIESIIM
ncbi:MAG: CRISPR-associated helicase Cas3' [Hyphomicrobiales bacterium]|nr:CRISPR-associated helicase Cas3' [Hyphomicrobiales bacterium]